MLCSVTHKQNKDDNSNGDRAVSYHTNNMRFIRKRIKKITKPLNENSHRYIL